jgi:hypothetical protein
VPDCSFGLAVAKELINHTITGFTSTSTEALNTKYLEDLYLHWKSALISDPKPLNFSLAFPWAVYEAKKDQFDPVFQQIERPSEIYLHILHDLALQPGCLETARGFQTKSSSQFKIFSFTSESPIWKLFVCYRQGEVLQVPLWLPAPDNAALHVCRSKNSSCKHRLTVLAGY